MSRYGFAVVDAVEHNSALVLGAGIFDPSGCIKEAHLKVFCCLEVQIKRIVSNSKVTLAEVPCLSMSRVWSHCQIQGYADSLIRVASEKMNTGQKKYNYMSHFLIRDFLFLESSSRAGFAQRLL